MDREPSYFLLIDQKKNVLPIRTEDAAELIRRVGLSDVRQHETLKQFEQMIREYFKEGWKNDEV